MHTGTPAHWCLKGGWRETGAVGQGEREARLRRKTQCRDFHSKRVLIEEALDD